MAATTAVVVSAAGAGDYVHWGVISISMTNLLIIVSMVVLFVLALLVPFPKPGEETRASEASEVPGQRQHEDRP